MGTDDDELILKVTILQIEKKIKKPDDYRNAKIMGLPEYFKNKGYDVQFSDEAKQFYNDLN